MMLFHVKLKRGLESTVENHHTELITRMNLTIRKFRGFVWRQDEPDQIVTNPLDNLIEILCLCISLYPMVEKVTC